MIFRLPLQTNHTLILKSNHTRFNQTRRLRRFSIQDPLYFKCSESPNTCIIPNFQTPNRFTTGFICNHMALEAWYMNDESDEDQRLPRHLNPKQFVSLSKLADLGVTYWHLNPKNYENDEELKKIRESRGYNYMDLLDLHPERVENYEQKLKNFFTEHIHADEEIRYCLEGSGYFDVRDNDDRWIRIWIKEGDMIVLPAGIYHRFTLDTSNYVKLMRLFIGEPVWTCYNRPQEEHPARKGYVKNVVEKVRVAVEAH